MSENGLFSVILAAGGATRFGAVKQLARIRGQTLIQLAAERAKAGTGERRVLVLGAAWRDIIGANRGTPGTLGFFAWNRHYDEGLGSSLACGIKCIEGVAEAVLILLVDQPLITDAHIRDLIEHWEGAKSNIVATAYAGIHGVPAIFPRHYFDELKSLRGDQGARVLLRKYSRQVIGVEFEDAAVDIDTEDDLEKLS